MTKSSHAGICRGRVHPSFHPWRYPAQITGSGIWTPESGWYSLSELERGRSYEVRISYPATTPAEFVFVISDNVPNAESRSSHRKLLNSEKIAITAPLGAAQPGISISVRRLGRRPFHSSRQTKERVMYTIVLSERFWGISMDAIPAGLAVVSLVSAGLAMIARLVGKHHGKHNRGQTQHVE
eukprot:jgi/Tetstr1/464856/TSEL_009594.t2